MIDVKKLEDTARMLRSMPGLCMQQGADAIDEVLRAMREPVGWQRRYKSDHMKWSRWEEWCTDAREDPFPAKIGRWDAEYRPIFAAPPAPVAPEPVAGIVWHDVSNGASASVENWERELSAVMPPDFKDWWENSKKEWPAVAATVIRNLREREALAMQPAVSQQPPLAP